MKLELKQILKLVMFFMISLWNSTNGFLWGNELYVCFNNFKTATNKKLICVNELWVKFGHVHDKIVIREPVLLECTFWQKHGLGVLASEHYSMQAGRLAQSATRYPIRVTSRELPGSVANLSMSHHSPIDKASVTMQLSIHVNYSES
jgi:hypothetical protein